NFHFYFRQEVHRVLAATVDFSMAFLPSETLDFGHRHSFYSNLAEGIFHLFKLEWFDNRFDLFHRFIGECAGIETQHLRLNFRSPRKLLVIVGMMLRTDPL